MNPQLSAHDVLRFGRGTWPVKQVTMWGDPQIGSCPILVFGYGDGTLLMRCDNNRTSWLYHNDRYAEVSAAYVERILQRHRAGVVLALREAEECHKRALQVTTNDAVSERLRDQLRGYTNAKFFEDRLDSIRRLIRRLEA